MHTYPRVAAAAAADYHAITILYDMKRSRYKLENIFALKICLTTFEQFVKKESAILLNTKKKFII
jgi:hypothetical protein